MLISDHLLPPAAKGAASVASAAAVAQAADSTIEVPADLYSLIAVALCLAGVYAARQVTIIDEEEASGRRRTYRQTGPLTWVAILIICPIIWHYRFPIPLASLLGLGVGFSARVLLRQIGDGTTGAFRSALRRALGVEAPPPPAVPAPPPSPAAPTLDAPGARPAAVILPPDGHAPDEQRLLRRLDDVPGKDEQ